MARLGGALIATSAGCNSAEVSIAAHLQIEELLQQCRLIRFQKRA
jgi:hypothetical protein